MWVLVLIALVIFLLSKSSFTSSDIYYPDPSGNPGVPWTPGSITSYGPTELITDEGSVFEAPGALSEAQLAILNKYLLNDPKASIFMSNVKVVTPVSITSSGYIPTKKMSYNDSVKASKELIYDRVNILNGLHDLYSSIIADLINSPSSSDSSSSSDDVFVNGILIDPETRYCIIQYINARESWILLELNNLIK